MSITLSPCPECHKAVTGYTYDSPVRPKVELEPLWEGGPLIEVPNSYKKLEHIPGAATFTVHPCEHVIDPSRFTVTVRQPAQP